MDKLLEKLPLWLIAIFLFIILILMLSGYSLQTPNGPFSITKLEPEAVETPDVVIVGTPSVSGSDSWRVLKSNVAYQAPNNGFVTVSSIGERPSTKIDILSGREIDNLQFRSRLGSAFGSAIIPVSKGEFFLVKPWAKDNDGEHLIQWKPM